MTQLAISQENLELLDALGTGENPHSRRTLKDHLIGTYDLLVDWGSENHVALGGLFHSVYGTQVYRIQSEDLSNRSRIAAAIGGRPGDGRSRGRIPSLHTQGLASPTELSLRASWPLKVRTR